MTMPDNSSAAPIGESAGKGTLNETPTAGARAQIREMTDQAVGEAKNSFRQARDSASSSLSQSRQQAADRISGLASAMRSTSGHLRSENQAGAANLTESLAEQAERLSSYLRDRDFRALRSDVEDFARRRPAVAIGAALALGMLGARFFKSSQRPDRSGGDREWGGGNVIGSGAAGGYGMSSQPAGGVYGAA
jgi:hypothetical protein